MFHIFCLYVIPGGSILMLKTVLAPASTAEFVDVYEWLLQACEMIDTSEELECDGSRVINDGHKLSTSS